jgi:DNA mismatch repair ATPase MutL
MMAYVDIGQVFFNKGFSSREYVILYLTQSQTTYVLTYSNINLYYIRSHIKSYHFNYSQFFNKLYTNFLYLQPFLPTFFYTQIIILTKFEIDKLFFPNLKM